MPLFVKGGLYETFQMTVALGTPSKTLLSVRVLLSLASLAREFNLTLSSFNGQDVILSADMVLSEGACSIRDINRSALYDPR